MAEQDRPPDLLTGLSGGACVAEYPRVWMHTIAIVRCRHEQCLVSVTPQGIVRHCGCFTIPVWERQS